MLWEALLGIITGTLSGITPGIHVNTLALMVRNSIPSAVTLFAMGLTHTFLDVFPSTFLGVPDEGSALSVLPAHRLVLRGRGMEVIRIAILSSVLAVLLSIPMIPLYTLLAPLYTPKAGKVIILLLSALLIATERDKVSAFLIYLLSGFLGLLLLSGSLREPLYHLLTGLFGVPALLAGLSGEKAITPGRAELLIARSRLVLFSLIGTTLGMVASLVPAFTASQAALIGTFISRDERSFLTVVYSVNTANFLFSTVNYLQTGRVRNGIVAMMPPVGLSYLPAFLLVALLTSVTVLLYGEPLSRLLAGLISRVPYRLINGTVLLFLFILSIAFDGLQGLLALTASSMIGYLTLELGVKRTNCMGALMLPLILR
ncbi:tripartite tricarboxylate transporter permease [Thermococcus sp.]|uniref:tripartite tricarboxylate transporter permease n=1 Tax=Thermococcus sp. TaxID=35749 RepID=UPI002627DC4F|nr:tripartite tricarboxylate transporter permease [Thermococcus sp.]